MRFARFVVLVALFGVLGTFFSVHAQERYVKIERVELDGQKLEVTDFIVDLYADPKSRGVRARSDRNGFFVPTELTDKDLNVVLFLNPQRFRLRFHQVSRKFFDSSWTIGIDTAPFTSENLGDRDPSEVHLIYYLRPLSQPNHWQIVTEMKSKLDEQYPPAKPPLQP